MLSGNLLDLLCGFFVCLFVVVFFVVVVCFCFFWGGFACTPIMSLTDITEFSVMCDFGGIYLNF